MKPLFIIFMFLSSQLFAQNIFSPPEIEWWLSEIREYKPSCSITDFVEQETVEIPLFQTPKPVEYFYPIFSRYNYSGTYISSFNYGIYLKKEMDGRYSISHNRGLSLILMDNKNNLLYKEDGSFDNHINYLVWLKDNSFIAVGYKTIGVDATTVGVDFFYNYYTITSKSIQIKKYRYYGFGYGPDDQNKVHMERFEWIRHRTDYFVY
jgi:hypothetical protein